MTKRLALILALSLAAAPGLVAQAEAPPAGSWASLASDRIARKVGDSLTVVINENATAKGSAENSSARSSNLQGQVAASSGTGAGVNANGNLGLNAGGDTSGTTTRAGAMVAQISVLVDAVLPNGDLHVSGEQLLNINGERTKIHVSGRVRAADISAANAVLSSDLADATIDYDGAGFVSDSSAPGLLSRALNWLGIP